LPLAERLDVEVQQATRVSKFFVGHGVHDPVVPFSLGDQTCRVLQQCGYDVQWHTYPMEHSVCREEIVHIGRFLTQVLQA